MKEPKHITLEATPDDPARATRVEIADARAQREGGVPPSAAAGSFARDPNKSSYAGYLFGSSGTDDRPAWSDSTQGRLAIRLFSRGVVGATFFVVGSHIAAKQLKGYESWEKIGPLRHDNFLRHIARGWDVGPGRAIEKMAWMMTSGSSSAKASAAWDATNFRTKTYGGDPKKPFRHVNGVRHTLNGRSLGAEIVTVTFDFFMASIGDAMTRNIIQAFDPNVRQPWLLDKDGNAATRDKGRFDAGKWAQSVGRASWRILTKNAGEDWAAALPYVYQMKWQRQALAKIWPGFKLASDYSVNGALSTIAMQDRPELGVKRGQVTGSYQAAGALDLQLRFVGYNWYTLMYRELYDTIGNKLSELRKGELKLDMPKDFNPLTAPVDGLGFLARYVTKSFIKANLYMQPAVIPFWLFRVPQSLWRGGLAIDEMAKDPHPNFGNAYVTTHRMSKALQDEHGRPAFVESAREFLVPAARLNNDKTVYDKLYYGTKGVMTRAELGKDGVHALNPGNPYASGVRRNWFESALRPFGWASFTSGTLLTKAVDGVFKGSAATRLHREKAVREIVDASFSYTPYMWLKAETALRVDDRKGVGELGHMDKAIYRLIDNTFSFNFKGAKKAIGDISHLAVNFEKDVKSREGIRAPSAEAAPAPANRIEKPSIELQGRQKHDPVMLERDADADKQHRQWAESVAGRKLDAQFQSSRATLH